MASSLNVPFFETFLRKTKGRHSKKRLALLRVHKTGSQSFRGVFQRCFSKQEICDVRFEHQMTPGALNGKRFAAPHMTVQAWLELNLQDSWTIAVTLREPRARLRSSFLYFRQKPLDHPTPVSRLLRDMNYSQYLRSEDPVVAGLRDNVLTRFIGGGHFASGASGRNQLVSISEDEDAAVARATMRLETGLVFPLILEKAAPSTSFLCAELGIKNAPALRWRNRTNAEYATLLASDELKKLELQRIAHDLRVYKAACSVVDSERLIRSER